MEIQTFLEQAFAQASTPQAQLTAQIQLVGYYNNHHFEKAEEAVYKGLALAEQLQTKEGTVVLLYYQMQILLRTLRLQQLLEVMERALKQLSDKHPMHSYLIGWFFKRLCVRFNHTRYLHLAIQYHQTCLIQLETGEGQTFETLFMPDLRCKVYLGLANLYMELSDMEEARHYLQLTNYFAQKISPSYLGESYFFAVETMCAYACSLEKQYAAGIRILERALHSEHKWNSMYASEMNMYHLLGLFVLELDQDRIGACQYFEKALTIAEHFKYTHHQMVYWAALAQQHEIMGNMQEAFKALKEAYKYQSLSHSDNGKSLLLSVQRQLEQKSQQTYSIEYLYKLLDMPSHHPDEICKSQAIDIFAKVYQQCEDAALDSERLASVFHVSPRTLSRRIQDLFGVPTKQFIIQVRMQKARQLLLSTDIPVVDVAFRVGYEHLSHFGVIFRKHFGILPSQVRLSKN